jgi:hypothetical protein
METSNDCVVIMCPKYSEYKEAPKDQSHSELFDCPECNCKMWLSDKKKGALMFASCLGKEIIFGCYDCIKQILEDGDLVANETIMVNL